MRIALVHMRHARTGGTERYLDRLAAHLAGAGHEVAVVCRSHEEAPHPAVRFVRLRPPAFGAAWRILGFGRAVAEHVRTADYDVVLGLGRTWTHDVVRLGGGCHATYLERMYPRPSARRMAELRPRDRARLAAERRALAPGAYSAVIVNSGLVARDARERYGIVRERLHVVQNGVDLARFHPRLRATAGAEVRAELGLGPTDVVLLFLGTGYARKGLDAVLRAFAALRAETPALRLVVAGHDSSAARYRALADRLGVGADARFLGVRRDPERVFAAADVYALPTRYDPFANATLEALATGLPTLTTAWNGGSELIEPGVQGDVLAEPDPDALAAALRPWLDPERRRAGAAAARELAEAHGIEAKLDRTLAILAAAAEERAARRPAAAGQSPT